MHAPSKIPDRIIRTASRLFSQHGYGVGIDRIIAEAEIAKMSLYKFFPSKAHLQIAVLNDAHEYLMSSLLESSSNTQSDQDKFRDAFLLSCRLSFDPNCMSSLITQALFEFPGHSSPVHQHAAQLRLETHVLFEQFAQKAQIPAPAAVAQQSLLLVHGFQSMYHVIKPEEALRSALALFECLVSARRA